jgi:hypothetical protein
MKFNLGQVVMTRGIADTMESNEVFRTEVDKAFEKYTNCDWGDTCEDDATMNTEAVKTGDDRILAVYQTSEGKIWIITEWDRSYTTILFPSEY